MTWRPSGWRCRFPPEHVFKKDKEKLPSEDDLVNAWRLILDRTRERLALKQKYDTPLFIAIHSGEFDDSCEEAEEEESYTVAHTILSQWLSDHDDSNNFN